MNIREFRRKIAKKLEKYYSRVTTHPYIPGISFRPSIFIDQRPPIVIMVRSHESVYSLMYQLIELRLYRPDFKIALLLLKHKSKHPMYRINENTELITEFSDVLAFIDIEELSTDYFNEEFLTKLESSSFHSHGFEFIHEFFMNYESSINPIEDLLQNRFPRGNYLALYTLLSPKEKTILRDYLKTGTDSFFSTGAYQKMKTVLRLPDQVNLEQDTWYRKALQLLLSKEVTSLLEHPLVKKKTDKILDRLFEVYKEGDESKIQSSILFTSPRLIRELYSSIAEASVKAPNRFSENSLRDILDRSKLESVTPAFRSLITQILIKPTTFDFFTDNQEGLKFYKALTITPFPYNRHNLSRVFLQGILFNTFCRRDIKCVLKAAIPPDWNMQEKEEKELLSYTLELLLEAGWIVETIHKTCNGVVTNLH